MVGSLVVGLLFGLVGLALVFGVFALLARAHALPFDRRGRLVRGRTDLPLTSGSCAASVAVEAWMEPADLPALINDALRIAGARDIDALDPWTTVGWTKISWRTWGQELGIVAWVSSPGAVTFLCCSRPRVASTLFDWGASQRTAEALGDQVRALVPAR